MHFFSSHLSHKIPINYIEHCCCRVQTVQKLNEYSVSYNYGFVALDVPL